jgi:hypothetical protein
MKQLFIVGETMWGKLITTTRTTAAFSGSKYIVSGVKTTTAHDNTYRTTANPAVCGIVYAVHLPAMWLSIQSGAITATALTWVEIVFCIKATA